MSTLVRNTRRTPTGASALWMGLLAVITSTFLTVGAFLWLAQDDPHPTSATAARNAASIRAANEQLKSLDHLKDDFMSSVTHELRTPLTSIRALSELMLDTPNAVIPPRPSGRPWRLRRRRSP